MSSKNLPERNIQAILKADEGKLTPDELKLKALYLEAEGEEEAGYEPVLQQIEIVHGHELYKFPGEKTTASFKGILLASAIRMGFYGKEQINGKEESIVYCGAAGRKRRDLQGKPTEAGQGVHSFLTEGAIQCISCPANKFPAGGGSKPCKESRSMLVYHPEYSAVFRMSVGPTSLKNHDRYYSELMAMQKRVWGTWTTFGLEHAEKGEQKWSVLTMRRDDDIADAALALHILEFRKQYQEQLMFDDTPESSDTSKPEGVEIKTEDEVLPF
jgi:hypothetical protein